MYVATPQLLLIQRTLNHRKHYISLDLVYVLFGFVLFLKYPISENTHEIGEQVVQA